MNQVEMKIKKRIKINYNLKNVLKTSFYYNARDPTRSVFRTSLFSKKIFINFDKTNLKRRFSWNCFRNLSWMFWRKNTGFQKGGRCEHCNAIKKWILARPWMNVYIFKNKWMKLWATFLSVTSKNPATIKHVSEWQ